MSYACLSDGAQPGCPYGNRLDRQSRVFEDLANGLHAMAQPLTVLRGALGALTLRVTSAAEERRYLEMSTKQVERMSDLLFCLQSFLDSTESKSDCTQVDLGGLIDLILEDLDSVVRNAGVKIAVEGLVQTVCVWGDAERIEQGIAAALKTIVSLCSQSEEILLSVLSIGDEVELVMRKAGRQDRTLSSFDRVNLALAEANIRSQRGRYRLVQDPLCVAIILPAQQSEQTACGIRSGEAPAQRIS